MGYYIQLTDKSGDPVQVTQHKSGSTYLNGGTTEAEINITYNYAKYFKETIDKDNGIRWIYNKTGEMCIPRLHSAVRELGTVTDEDYWSATPGNVGHILSILLAWAKLHPNAIFMGD